MKTEKTGIERKKNTIKKIKILGAATVFTAFMTLAPMISKAAEFSSEEVTTEEAQPSENLSTNKGFTMNTDYSKVGGTIIGNGRISIYAQQLNIGNGWSVGTNFGILARTGEAEINAVKKNSMAIAPAIGVSVKNGALYMTLSGLTYTTYSTSEDLVSHEVAKTLSDGWQGIGTVGISVPGFTVEYSRDNLDSNTSFKVALETGKLCVTTSNTKGRFGIFDSSVDGYNLSYKLLGPISITTSQSDKTTTVNAAEGEVSSKRHLKGYGLGVGPVNVALLAGTETGTADDIITKGQIGITGAGKTYSMDINVIVNGNGAEGADVVDEANINVSKRFGNDELQNVGDALGNAWGAIKRGVGKAVDKVNFWSPKPKPVNKPAPKKVAAPKVEEPKIEAPVEAPTEQ